MPEFSNCVDELEFYSYIRIERHRKNVLMNQLSLNVELDELNQNLHYLIGERREDCFRGKPRKKGEQRPGNSAPSHARGIQPGGGG